MEFVKCPKCGNTYVVDDECTNVENTGSAVVLTYHGGCEWCGASVTWEEVFTFKEIANVRVCE